MAFMWVQLVAQRLKSFDSCALHRGVLQLRCASDCAWRALQRRCKRLPLSPFTKAGLALPRSNTAAWLKARRGKSCAFVAFALNFACFCCLLLISFLSQVWQSFRDSSVEEAL